MAALRPGPRLPAGVGHLQGGRQPVPGDGVRLAAGGAGDDAQQVMVRGRVVAPGGAGRGLEGEFRRQAGRHRQQVAEGHGRLVLGGGRRPARLVRRHRVVEVEQPARPGHADQDGDDALLHGGDVLDGVAVRGAGEAAVGVRGRRVVQRPVPLRQDPAPMEDHDAGRGAVRGKRQGGVEARGVPAGRGRRHRLPRPAGRREVERAVLRRGRAEARPAASAPPVAAGSGPAQASRESAATAPLREIRRAAAIVHLRTAVSPGRRRPDARADRAGARAYPAGARAVRGRARPPWRPTRPRGAGRSARRRSTPGTRPPSPRPRTRGSASTWRGPTRGARRWPPRPPGPASPAGIDPPTARSGGSASPVELQEVVVRRIGDDDVPPQRVGGRRARQHLDGSGRPAGRRDAPRPAAPRRRTPPPSAPRRPPAWMRRRPRRAAPAVSSARRGGATRWRPRRRTRVRAAGAGAPANPVMSDVAAMPSTIQAAAPARDALRASTTGVAASSQTQGSMMNSASP